MKTQLPPYLASFKAQGGQTNEPIAQFELGSMKNFVYLILDWGSRRAGMVDSQRDLKPVLSFLKENSFHLESLFFTHTHHDHIDGIKDLIKLFPQLRIHTHPDDLHRLEGLLPQDAKIIRIHDHQILALGSLSIKVLHTPGHSAGECCYYLMKDPGFLFTGDTLFIRDCGRTDLPTGDNQEMFDSLQRIRTLPKKTIILPGHHYQNECASTLEVELQQSPPFQCKTPDQLAALP